MHGSAGGRGGGVFRGDLGGGRRSGPRRPEKPRAGVELAPGLLGGSRASHPPGPGSGSWLGEGLGESAGGKRELHPPAFFPGRTPPVALLSLAHRRGWFQEFFFERFFFSGYPPPPRTGIGSGGLRVGPIRCMFAPVTWVTWNLGTDSVVSTLQGVYKNTRFTLCAEKVTRMLAEGVRAIGLSLNVVWSSKK